MNTYHCIVSLNYFINFVRVSIHISQREAAIASSRERKASKRQSQKENPLGLDFKFLNRGSASAAAEGRGSPTQRRGAGSRPAPGRPEGGTADRARLCARLRLLAPRGSGDRVRRSGPHPASATPGPRVRASATRGCPLRPALHALIEHISTWTPKGSRDGVFRGGRGAPGTGPCVASGDLETSGSHRAEEGKPRQRAGTPGGSPAYLNVGPLLPHPTPPRPRCPLLSFLFCGVHTPCRPSTEF